MKAYEFGVKLEAIGQKIGFIKTSNNENTSVEIYDEHCVILSQPLLQNLAHLSVASEWQLFHKLC